MCGYTSDATKPYFKLSDLEATKLLTEERLLELTADHGSAFEMAVLCGLVSDELFDCPKCSNVVVHDAKYRPISGTNKDKHNGSFVCETVGCKYKMSIASKSSVINAIPNMCLPKILCTIFAVCTDDEESIVNVMKKLCSNSNDIGRQSLITLYDLLYDGMARVVATSSLELATRSSIEDALSTGDVRSGGTSRSLGVEARKRRTAYNRNTMQWHSPARWPAEWMSMRQAYGTRTGWHGQTTGQRFAGLCQTLRCLA
jgi:hypothetical protein